MHASHTTVASRDAQRLLRTLVNHWRHKFDIRRDDDAHAHVPFAADGSADFRIDGDALRIEVRHAGAAELQRLQQVIENHLQRFARDETLAFAWAAAGG